MTLSPLLAPNAPASYRLSTQAGWNQTVADWRLMLKLGKGHGVFENNELIATTLYLRYPPIAWIGMVLVDVRYRRRGLATLLMERCLEDIAKEGLYPMLDATEAGNQVYRKYGFEAFASITRLEGQPVPSPLIPSMTPSSRQIEAIQAIDEATFGGDRRGMIKAWAKDHAASCYFETDTPVRNYGFVRPGRQAWHIGPLVSDDMGASLNIVSSLTSGRTGHVFLDIPDNQTLLQSHLKANGFIEKRRFLRMSTRNTSPLDDRLQAIAGPEWG